MRDPFDVSAASVDLIVLAGGRGSRLGGVDKASVEVAGRTLLSRALDARVYARHVVVVGPESARPAAAVRPGASDRPGTGAAPLGIGTGPDRGTDAGVGPGADVVATAEVDTTVNVDTVDATLTWTLEDPPFGGPVAGIAAGLAALDRRDVADPSAAGWVLVLACDIPLAADAARLLVDAVNDPSLPGSVDGLHLVDDGGRPQWLAGVYRAEALRAAVRRLGDAVHGASMRGLLGKLALRGIHDPGGIGNDVDTWQDVARSTTELSNTESDASAPQHDTFEE